MEVAAFPVDGPTTVPLPDSSGAFRPLYEVLARHSGPEIVLSIAAIERRLGSRLPLAARTPGWWLSDIAGAAAPNSAWRAAGFLAELQAKEKAVRFRRTVRAYL